MDIKKHIKKIYKASPFGLLALGFIVGIVVTVLYFQPKLAYQGKTAKDWAGIDRVDSSEADILTKSSVACAKDPSSKACDPILYASYSTAMCGKSPDKTASAAEIVWRFKHCPAPTPIIEYKTQYVQEPAQKAQQKPRLPVTYNSYGGDVLYGSDGSTCNTYGGSTVYCTGGN